jgi:hypothetical protein
MLPWQYAGVAGDFAGLWTVAGGRCRAAGGLCGCLLEPPWADGKGQMVTVRDGSGGAPEGGEESGPDGVSPVAQAGRGTPVCQGCHRGVPSRTIPSQDRACPASGREPARPGAHPRNMSVNRGTACPRSCSRCLHAPCAMCRLRLVLPVRPVPGFPPAARLCAALSGADLGCPARPVSLPADGAAPRGTRPVAGHFPPGHFPPGDAPAGNTQTSHVRPSHVRTSHVRTSHTRTGPDRTAPGPWLLRSAVLVAARRARPGVAPG